MMLSPKKLYLLLASLVALSLLVLGGSTYMGEQVLKKKSQDVRDARLENLVLEQKQGRLRKAKTDIEKYKDLAEIAKSIVPRDKDQARTVRELTNLAADHNIRLGSITFPSSSLGAKPTKGSTGDSQLKAVPNIAGTYVLSINVISDTEHPTNFKDFTRFLESLEQNRRTALVTAITITPNTGDPDELQFTLTLDEYIKP